MEVLNKCREWLESNPDQPLIKQKLTASESTLANREAISQLLESWVKQLDESIESPSVGICEFPEEVRVGLGKWLNWLTESNPDRDVLVERQNATDKQVDEYRLVVDALIDHIGNNFDLDSNNDLEPLVETNSTHHSASEPKRQSVGDVSYSLGQEVDSSIPVFTSSVEKNSAFELLKKQLGVKEIVTNRKTFDLEEEVAE